MTGGRTQSHAGVVFLAGPPGAGKSTAAISAARRLGIGAADLDAVIEAATGQSPDELIRVNGENVFRERELDALRSLDPSPKVVALGGGTLTRKDARREARVRGMVVGLNAAPEVLAERLAQPQGSVRPLLPDPSLDAVQALLDRRRRAYASADRLVPVVSGVEAVVDEIVRAVDDVHVVRATVGAQDSRVLVGRRLEQSLVGAVAHLDPQRPAVVITDTGIPQDVRRRWITPLSHLYDVVVIEGPGGESVKEWAWLGQTLERALEGGAGRQSVVVGFGGGATCDLAAMVAALLGRGAPLILVPSTLLAQVDASVGGKAAVNAQAGRNLIGTFHAAEDVLVDPELLVSLPAEEHRSGRAELAKIAALFDAALFERIVTDLSVTPSLLARAIALKADVVARDPFERHERKLLNFGHTLAHGLEAASNYGWRHGDAVAVGMATVARWSVAEGWMSEDAKTRLLQGLTELGLPIEAPFDLLNDAVGFLARDKKAAGDKITVVTLQELAQPILREISLASVRQAMIQYGGDQ